MARQTNFEKQLEHVEPSFEISKNDIRLLETDQVHVARTESNTYCLAGTPQRPLGRLEAETIRYIMDSFVDYEPFYNLLFLLERLKENADQMLFIEQEFRREYGIGYSKPFFHIEALWCSRRDCQFCAKLGQPHSLLWKKAVMRRIEKQGGTILYRPYLTPFQVRRSRTENGRRHYYYETVYSSKSLPHSFFKSKRMRQTKERFKIYNEAVKQLNSERVKLMRLHNKGVKGITRKTIDAIEPPGIDFTQISREQIEKRKDQNRQRFKEKRGLE